MYQPTRWVLLNVVTDALDPLSRLRGLWLCLDPMPPDLPERVLVALAAGPGGDPGGPVTFGVPDQPTPEEPPC